MQRQSADHPEDPHDMWWRMYHVWWFRPWSTHNSSTSTRSWLFPRWCNAKFSHDVSRDDAMPCSHEQERSKNHELHASAVYCCGCRCPCRHARHAHDRRVRAWAPNWMAVRGRENWDFARTHQLILPREHYATSAIGAWEARSASHQESKVRSTRQTDLNTQNEARVCALWWCHFGDHDAPLGLRGRPQYTGAQSSTEEALDGPNKRHMSRRIASLLTWQLLWENTEMWTRKRGTTPNTHV